MDSHQDHLITDGDLRTELENIYENNSEENILAQFEIDSKYYQIDQIKSNIHDEYKLDYKYNTLHLNIQGLMSSKDNLEHLLNKLESANIYIDFILLCEIFLYGSEQELQCHIPGYQFVCTNRKSKTKGGVGIYVNNKHQFKIRNDLSTFIEGEYETIFIEINSKTHKAIIGEIYRIPNTPTELSLYRYEDTITKLLKNKTHDIIIGTDQNFDYLKINDHKPTSDLFDHFISNGLVPVITKPTRITHSTASLIDNIYIKLNDTHVTSGILTTKLSDHLPIFAFYGKTNRTKPEPVTRESRKLNDTNILKIKNKLIRYDWSRLRQLNSNDSYNEFLDILTRTIDNVAPMKTIRLSVKRLIREPWVTKEIIKTSVRLDKLYKQCINMPNEHPVTLEFKSKRNQFNKQKREAKQQYYKLLFNKYRHDIRKSWELMRTIIKKKNDKSNISESFKLDNKTINDPKDIASAFCDYFTNIGPNLSKQIPPPIKTSNQYMHNNPPINSLFMIPTDINEISTIIKQMKPKKSTGPDNISSWLLRELNLSISEPLSIIINKSMEQGIFPNQLKLAKIIPIYKSKDKEQFNNYRPISLLSSISKIFEKIVYKRLYTFIEPVLYNKQFGFRTKRSTIQAVMELCVDIMDSFENKQITMATFLDLSKAFDTIDHNILIGKLFKYGIRGIALDWFTSYLKDRKHFIQYKSQSSPINLIQTGVPQGSVLGPLLFIIYTNDLPHCLSNTNSTKCILFADDTTIYETSTDLNRLYNSMNDNLNTLADWFRANKLSLNVSKTIYMIFGNSQIVLNNEPPVLKLGPEIIKRVETTKFLGLHIDDKLKWTKHLKHIKSKLSSSLFAIRSAKHILNSKQLKTIYSAMFHPYLEYGAILWGSARQTVLRPIELMQKKALRLITNSQYNTHTDPLFKAQNILKVKDLHDVQVNKFMYQYQNNSLPETLSNLFTNNHIIHNHATRHSNDPHIMHRRTTLAAQSIIHKGPKLWQSIEQNTKESKTIHTFSRKLKKSIIGKY